MSSVSMVLGMFFTLFTIIGFFPPQWRNRHLFVIYGALAYLFFAVASR